MDYNTALQYVNSFINFEKIPRYNYASSFRLDRMHAFLEGLGNPHHALDVIHVAGSKGKGSTCAIIAFLLRRAGYRVGLYTSPHLLDTMERIRVLDEGLRCGDKEFQEFEGKIEEKDFIELIKSIAPVAEKFRDHKVLGRLSFFEVLTACAFLYFKEKKVHFAILETGLGGRLDATNVTDALVYGITSISLEHTDKLGSSLESIAREKAGIIKNRRPDGKSVGTVFTVSQEREASEEIMAACSRKKAALYEIGKDITYSIVDSGEDTQRFNVDGPGYSYKDLQMNLIGTHQVENAVLAIAMVKSIDKISFKIDEKTVRYALKELSWPGRLQVVQKEPYVILDGAQNIASIKAVISSIKEIFYYSRLISIFGISSDKDIKGVSRELDEASDMVILTRSGNERAKEPSYLKENFSGPNIALSETIEEALKLSLEKSKKEDLILVTGSLYMVGDAMKALEKSRGCTEPIRKL